MFRTEWSAEYFCYFIWSSIPAVSMYYNNVLSPFQLKILTLSSRDPSSMYVGASDLVRSFSVSPLLPLLPEVSTFIISTKPAAATAAACTELMSADEREDTAAAAAALDPMGGGGGGGGIWLLPEQEGVVLENVIEKRLHGMFGRCCFMCSRLPDTLETLFASSPSYLNPCWLEVELGDEEEGYLFSPFKDEDEPAAASSPLVDVDVVPVPVPPSA